MDSKKETKTQRSFHFLSDNRGISPVVGVLLLLAITVIMAGYLATEVLSYEFTSPSPPVSLNARVETMAVGSSNYTVLRLEHSGGASLQVSDIRILVNQSEADLSSLSKKTFGIGESVTICGIENNKTAVLSYPVSETKKPSQNIINKGETIEVIVIDSTNNQILFKKTILNG